ncbi:acyltransferase family protein [Gallibacterium anatis]|uniref:acyltransferase family protein n=1 Tax=Gallibacterium anatis TaxID=750 RepID=UPI0009C16ED2|nr:acyltransferase [Gallibacterium anatis]
MSSIKYRPEIDGLRAIAVISVIIFHFKSDWLPGGFLGVDIFFVISGYLITKIITTEISNNTFTYKNFYNRRIKRIYPIFISVIFITSLISMAIFTYDDFNTLRKSVEFSTLFITNIYFSKSQGYFDLDLINNPTLHIWSLAIEEQYYLLFPLILILIYKRFPSKKSFYYIIISLFILSVSLTFIPSSFYTKYVNVYYLPQLRFFELLIGSWLLLLPPPLFHLYFIFK